MKNLFNRTCKQSPMDGAKCMGTKSGYGICEELYQKESGEFFLYGKGGLSTKYAVHCCGNLIAGSKIIPLTNQSAQQWVKTNLSDADYATIFSQHI